ncbi:radical SAM/SPASM domain-containing protein [Oceanirhabdus sp. W0125-5]|uniref:radical SAM/SPASM domain-containing protein n=1 Tax=Oceanirhabdus sp. W0125-5 TaxID=2999116 RepID=UPI0022F2EC51|nr:radical SAM protein [Oceanirhabdus sp. W0125-5]WBW96324.1 radical SAM protein [Oceanirhabdus sp. W0125-5]
MKFYLDNRIIFMNTDDNYVNIYTPHAHSTLKINEAVSTILKKIIEIGSGNSFNPDDILDIFNGECSLDDLESVLNVLVECKFLFKSESDFINNSFYNTIKNTKAIKLNTVYLHLTQRCNLNCSYCYNKHNLNGNKGELTLEQWKDTIDKLRNNGVQNYILTGGEPLLRDEIIDIVKYIKRFDSNVALLTNGTLLHKNSDLLQFVDKVTVSLDSIDDKINDANRSNSNKYNLINNLKVVAPEYRHKFTVRSVLTNKNLDKIDEIKAFVEENLNMNHITALFSPNSPEEVALIPDYSAYLSKIRGSELNEFSSGVINCGACFNELAVDANGDLYPCQALIKDDLKIGNILSPDWLEALKTSKVTCDFIDRDVHKIEKCKDCDYKYICGGGCRAIAYNVYGDLNAHLKCYCDHMKNSSNVFLLNTMFNKN